MVLDLVSLLLLFLGFPGVLVFNFMLLIAHAGYLQDHKTFYMCVCSSSSWPLLEYISLALCSSELMTLYLLDMAWWLSHCRYWLVWVGFLYTVVDRLPSLWDVTKVSKKGIAPSALVVSAVNLIFSSIELMWWKNSYLYCAPKMTKVSSTNLFHRLGGCGAVSRTFCFRFLHKDVGHYGAEWWSHCFPIYLFIILPLEHKACTFLDGIPKDWWYALLTWWFFAADPYHCLTYVEWCPPQVE